MGSFIERLASLLGYIFNRRSFLKAEIEFFIRGLFESDLIKYNAEVASPKQIKRLAYFAFSDMGESFEIIKNKSLNGKQYGSYKEYFNDSQWSEVLKFQKTDISEIKDISFVDEIIADYVSPNLTNVDPVEVYDAHHDIHDPDFSLWYPHRETPKELKGRFMRTVGSYEFDYPEGAIIHATASPNSLMRGADNPSDIAINHLLWQARKAEEGDVGAYCYFLIDGYGKVYQQFPLNKWGHHAGESKDSLGRERVSQYYVGIEIMNAGKLIPSGDGRYKTWWQSDEDADEFFTPEMVNQYDKDILNIQKGAYQMADVVQFKSLLKLIHWLHMNNPSVFSLDSIYGHDEVSGKRFLGRWRKTDPGGIFCLTMRDIRSKIRSYVPSQDEAA